MIKNNKKLIGTGILVGTMATLSGAIALGKKLKIKKKMKNKVLENKQYSTGRIRKFGTLYLDDEKQKNPIDFLEFKDVPIYVGQKIEIRDTDKNEENKLYWIEINDNNKKFLICDRNILKEIAWNELNEQNLVFGKVVIIEGEKYILRLLTGYSEKKSLKLNEWDRYIVNVEKMEGLPVSKDYDIDNNLKQYGEQKLNGANNNLWHWYNFSSYTQSEGERSEKFCIIRGLYSTTYSKQSVKDLKYGTVGYRPVLELIE
jgi:hypothetical protein